MTTPLPIRDLGFDEQADILAPPRFEPTGQTKAIKQAVADGDWLGSFQLWLYMRQPEPCLLYQQRSLTGPWAPGKLDVTAAGYYHAGERGLDGLREVNEELGLDIDRQALQLFGRKINVNIDGKQRERHSVSNIYFAEFSGQLEDLTLEEAEVESIFALPLRQLVDLFNGTLSSFAATGLQRGGTTVDYTVTIDSFPYNFDDYHRRMALFFALKLGVSNAYLGD